MRRPVTALRGGGATRKTVLPNGVRILSEEMPGISSLSIGIWVESGARYERVAQNGLSHLIEHLVFKGTERRTAAAISEEIDAVGGVLNADTDREHTCYYAKVLGEDAGLAVDLLGDMVLASRFDPDEIAREKEVVLEEIARIEDTPDDYIQDLFHLEYWPDHALGRPICGTHDSVSSFDRQACVDLLAERYRPNRIVVAAAGRIEHAWLVDEIARRFGELTGEAPLDDGPPPVARSGVTVHPRKLGQVQLALATRGVSATDPRRAAGLVLNTALGDSSSSRLFQEVRERRGRVYSIDSFLCSFRDAGYLGIAAGTRPRWVAEVVETILGELRKVRREGFDAAELARAKGKLKGTILLALETSDQRMERIALNEMYVGRDVPEAELGARIDAVTNDEVVGLAGELLVPEGCSIVLLGDLKGPPLDARILEALG